MEKVNLEAMAKSQKNYMAAMRKTLKIVGGIEPRGNYPHGLFPLEFRAVTLPFEQIRSQTTSLYVRVESLFEYGRPRMLQPEMFPYRDFVRWYAHIEVPFKTYAPNYMGEVKEGQGKLDVIAAERSVGLKDWDVKLESTLAMFDDCKASISQGWREKILEADKEVKRWKVAIAEYVNLAK